MIAVPIFAFYATGYRYNFFSGERITATGGLYITVEQEDAELFLNEEAVTEMRTFRNALYIQNMLPGVQRLHVQAPGMHTWVKELPIYAHIVTEAEAMLYPVRPQLRLITQYETATGTSVIWNAGTSTVPAFLAFSSTTEPYVSTSSRATTTLIANEEFDYVADLFGTSTAATSTIIGRVVDEVASALPWGSGTTTDPRATSTATTTIIMNDLALYEAGGEVYVQYSGPDRSVPYYFCIPTAMLASTTEFYGPQVMSGVAQVLAAASTSYPVETDLSYQTCRDTIRMDRQNQTVQYFNFMPGTTDHVFLARADKLVAVEVDDRAWQNTQVLYPEPVEGVVIDNGRIYIKDDGYFFELLLTIDPE